MIVLALLVLIVVVLFFGEGSAGGQATDRPSSAAGPLRTGGATRTTVSLSHWHRYRDARLGVTGRLPPGWRAAPDPLVPNLARSREVFAAATFAPVVGARHPCWGEPTASFARMAPGDALVTVSEDAPSKTTIARFPDYFLPRPASYDLSNGLWLHKQHMGEVPARMGIDFRASGRYFSALIAIRGAPAPALLHRISAVLTGLRFRRLPREPISVPAGRIQCGCRGREG